MQKRKLGSDNLAVSAIGLGCMGMSFSYGPPADQQEMISVRSIALPQKSRCKGLGTPKTWSN